jgi:hypothetical protein
MKRFILILAVVLLLVTMLAPAALAAAPSNDTFIDATPVTLGFSEVLDTTEATTDGNDAQLGATCVFGTDPVPWPYATDASVWYAFTATADAQVKVKVLQPPSYPPLPPDYYAGILVGTGSQGNLQNVANTCSVSGEADFFATAGITYYVLVVDMQFEVDPVVNGGSLSISFEGYVIPPPPTLDFTLNRFGQVDTRTGIATISGSYTCTNSLWFSTSLQSAYQNVGRFTISGYGGSFYDNPAPCDGTPHPWAFEVSPVNSKFAGGKLMTEIVAYTCNSLFQCAHWSPPDPEHPVQTVQLRGGGK